MTTIGCKWHGRKTANGACALCYGNNSDMHRLCFIDESEYCIDYERDQNFAE